MAQTIKLKRSSTAGKVPGTGNLSLGELAINTYDGRIFFKKNDGSDAIEHIVTTDSITTGSISLTSKVTAATLTLSGLSAQSSEATSLMINGSGVVGTRELGSNAFNSTAYATGDNFDSDGTFASLRAQGTTKGDVGLGNVENTALSTYTGDGGSLDNQYITNGANYVTAGVTLTTAAQPNITSLGTLTTLTVDDITLNGSTISDGGTMTMDIGGDLVIDVDGADIQLKDGGTEFGRFSRVTSDFVIRSITQDKDILFKGNDGGSTITALQLDMSNGGSATFLDDIDFGGKLTQTGTGGNTLVGDLTISNAAPKIYLTDTNNDDDFIIANTNGVFQIQDDVGARFQVQSSGVVEVKTSTQSTSKTTGGLVVDGGVGIAKTLNVGEDVVAYASSDERYKDNVTPIENPNDKIKQIGGYTFDWNDKHEVFKGQHDVGVIAQEIEKVLPEIVETRESGYKAVKYEKIVALLIESNKELLKRVEELESKIK